MSNLNVKIIPNTNGRYTINEKGEVYSTLFNKIMTSRVNKSGSHIIKIRLDNKKNTNITVEKLVAELFYIDYNTGKPIINKEDMKYIPNTNDKFLISKDGVVFSTISNKVLKQRKNGAGNFFVELQINKNKTKNLTIHKLLKQLFNIESTVKSIIPKEGMKEIPDTGMKYSIDEEGKVYSNISKKFMKIGKDKTGNNIVSLVINTNNTKKINVDKLVKKLYNDKTKQKFIDNGKEIPNCNGNYFINNNGEIYSNITCKLVSQHKKKSGVNIVKLKTCENKFKTYTTHILVYKIFNKPINKNEIIIHNDNNKDNNHVDNLKAIKRTDIKHKTSPISIEGEEWKYIKKYGDKYMVSNRGNIFSLHRKSLMTLIINSGGYKTIKLIHNKNKRQQLIHHLVYKTFVGDIKKNYVIDHIDRNKTNNCLNNLRMVTKSENCRNVNKNIRGKEVEVYKDDKLIGKYKNINTSLEKLNINGEINKKKIYNAIKNNKIIYGIKWKYVKEKEIILKSNNFITVKNFDGFELSNYKINEYGNIIKNEKILKQHIKCGYYAVDLTCKNNKKKSKTFRVHRLVANTFILNNDKTRNIVNHLDENKLNNHYLNLSWVTNTENIQYSCGKRVNKIDIISGNIIMKYNSLGEINREFNRDCRSVITNRCNNTNNNIAYNYKWSWA